jgi:MHS family proline/betaine transporter-like MFS transporter
VSPVGGKLTDRLKRRKPMLYVTGVAGVLLLYPAFALMLRIPSLITILLSVTVIVGLRAVSNPTGFLLLLEGFPREIRGRSLGIVYSVGVTLFGGFAPFIVTWLLNVTQSPYAPVWYMAVCSLVSLAALPMFNEVVTD